MDRPRNIAEMRRVTITDVRRAGHCASGVMRWFLDKGFTRDEFRAFLRDGISAEEFWDRGDAYSRRVVLAVAQEGHKP